VPDLKEPAATEDPVEIEWQFDALDLRPVERWLAALPGLAVEAGDIGTVTALARTPRRLVDSYLDTDDWRIARAGFVARTRRRGRHDEVTLKDTRPAEGSGLRQRLEVTEVLPPSGISALGADGPVGRRLRAIVGARGLREVLQVRTRRRPFALRVGGVDAAEIALDDTVIVVGSGQRPMQLRRVEVEVQPDWLDALEPIVEQLRASCGLQPAALSKFEAGLLALGEEIPGSPDLGPTAVGSESTMGELAFAVLRRQLTVLRDKEPGTRLGEDPEDLHVMRVATRRLRAALTLFAGVLPVRAQVFREELGWVAGLLGVVRDLDVQLEGLADAGPQRDWAWSGTAGDVEGNATADPLGELVVLLERERTTARAAMLGALDSMRWERLARGMAAMAQQGPARRSLATREPAVIALPALVEERHAAVAKATQRAKRTAAVPDYHRLRIRCKRLRYALEFGAEVYDGRPTRYVRQLVALQGELGLMQDAEVASMRLAELATGEIGATALPPATVFVMGAMAERHHRDVDRLLKRLPKELARVDGREWRDLHELMDKRRAAAEAALPPVRHTLRSVPPPEPTAEPATDAPGATPERPLTAAPIAVHPAGPATDTAPHPSAGPAPAAGPHLPIGAHPAGGGGYPGARTPGLAALAPPPSGEGE
jgi:CHAD domain-containing protein